jgi:hypothetical protein
MSQFCFQIVILILYLDFVLSEKMSINFEKFYYIVLALIKIILRVYENKK